MYGDSLERKLLPIYDAIDGGSYKNALKHAEAALKKFPGNQLLRALRAYALHKCGRVNAAVQELEGIIRDGPESERVLHTMSFTLKAVGRSGDIMAAYEGAAQKRPGDLDIMIGLFGAYVKEMNFAKQQQTALKIAKLHPSKADQCFWWAITSVALQARSAALAKELVLASQLMKLAETMANKQMSKNSVKLSYEMLLLYVDVLQGQGKGEEACKVITQAGETAQGLQDDRLQLEAAALCRAGDLEAAAALYYQACTADLNDWNSWHLYLDCVLPKSAKRSQRKGVSCYPVGVVGGLAETWDFQEGLQLWSDAGAQQDSIQILSSVQRAQDAVQSLQDKVSHDPKGKGARGVALASLELVRRQQMMNLFQNPGMEMADSVAKALPALIQYKSCMSDVQNYLHCIRTSDHEALTYLASKVKGIADETRATIASLGQRNAQTKCYQCLVNKHVLLRYLDRRPGQSEHDGVSAFREALGYFERYTENKHLSESLDPKERGYGEELVELAVQALVAYGSNANASEDAAWPLLAALLILESVQVQRTVSSPLRLAACAIYGLLYAPDIAAAHFSALDIKGILHETLTGHWMLPILLAGSSSTASVQKWLDGMANVHELQLSEASDAFFTAFESGSYSKIPEMVDFWETLQNSSSFAIWRAEASVQLLKKAVGNVEELRKAAVECSSTPERIELDRLYHVEDLSTRPSWYTPYPARSIGTAIGTWWRCQGRTADCWPWWHCAVAGEQECDEAQIWRTAMKDYLFRRISLTNILAKLLSPKPLDEDECLKGKALVHEAWSSTLEINSMACDCSISAENFLLLPSLFEAGFAIHSFARVTENKLSDTVTHQEIEMQCSAAYSALNGLVERASAVCKHLVETLTCRQGRSKGLLLPANEGVAFVSEIISEDMAWISSCLVSWCRIVDDQCADASKIKVLHEIRQAAATLHTSVQLLLHALQTCIERDTNGAAKELMKELEGRLPPGCKLFWEHEGTFDAESMITRLLKAQSETAKRLIESGEKVLNNFTQVKVAE